MATRQGFAAGKLFLAITLLTTSALLEIAAGYADAQPQTPQTAQEQTAPSPELNNQDRTFDNTVDDTHGYIEQNILKQVVRLDDFFGSVRTENMRQASYLLRWKSSLSLGDDGRLKPATTIRADIHLSAISERLRLSIAGENVKDTETQSLPEDPGSPGLDRTTQSARVVNTELRYILKQTPHVESFLGAGIRLIVPPETFIRGRYLYNHQLSNIALLRLGETIFLKKTGGLGETTEISLERLLSPKALLRLANTGTVSQSIDGMEWGSELSLIQELSSKSAVSVTGGVYGNSSSSNLATSYRILTNYRRNFLKPWLYYELEPRLTWARDTRYAANFAFTLRIEVMFAASDADHGK